ncbi:TA system antitoxin ParD family protein [Variovorax boronicumulans]|uniref:TA system antitoxin ParD family protein n=2 Tax=Variovorax boronicumulans TaxID=436515 RepID=UPI0027D7C20E|nr:hypothetical protein [Variovorax boronicumulans]
MSRGPWFDRTGVVVICHNRIMTSNSIRIGKELFDAARAEGTVMSRSAAQQIEHWARIGAALEVCDLTVAQVSSLLRDPSKSGEKTEDGDAQLWAFKRARQRADLESMRSGLIGQKKLSWFQADKVRDLKLVDSPY